jgi:hypothetical protein
VRAKTNLRNTPRSKSKIKELLRFDRRTPSWQFRPTIVSAASFHHKPSKTAAELEASIKVEMEDICDWPTDMAISFQPDGDSWKVKVVQEGSVDDADRREMVEQIAARLRAE